MHALLLTFLCQAPVVPLLDPAKPQATLRFAVRDPFQHLIPARLTFRGAGGAGANLFTKTDAAPDELAVRKNVVYSLSGTGAITVPVGKFRVYASHGLEWSLAQADFEFEAGREYSFEPVLKQEIDSTGWISGDFHLHTLTHSGHGDSNLKERIISLVGEGVEFAVATDHNHNTDYGPDVESLKVSEKIAHITGNEVTTPIGHFNAFPLDPERPPVESSLRNAEELFRIVKAEPNEYGVVPVIQLNHPRYVPIDWFGQTGLDPATGTSAQASWSDAFDALEIFNANASWGYFDAEIVADQGPSVHSVLNDWFHLLNRGSRHAAIGNSDSHTVHYEFAGFPRNFLQLGIDDVPEIRAKDVVQAIRAKRLFTTTGPFLKVSIDDAPLGAQIAAAARKVSINIEVQAAGWCDVDRVKLVVNGDVRAEWAVPQSRTPLRFQRESGLDLSQDAWVVVMVEGDDPIDPMIDETKDRCLPLAVTNPVWIDADGDGKFIAPWARVRDEARGASWSLPFAARGAFEQGLVCLAAVEEGRKDAASILTEALKSNDREVLLCAARAAEKLGKDAPIESLESAWQRCRERDGYLQLALVRALSKAGSPGWQAKLAEAVAAMLKRASMHGSELQQAFEWRWLEDWESGGTRAIESSGLGKFAPAAADTTWKTLPADQVRKGRLNLAGSPEMRESRVQGWIVSPDEREVFFALGVDDDACMWVNGVETARRSGSGRTDPPQIFGRMKLIQGANRVEIQVQNRGGAHGLRLGVLESGLQLRR